ncbi:MAG: AI-2E family transporter [Candidatus Taylorbacteria bacterium]
MIKGSANYFFYTILIGTIILAGLMILPILTPLVLAGAFAVIFAPLNRWVLKTFFHGREKSSFGAIVTVIILAIFIFVPLALLSFTMYGEIKSTYLYITDATARSQVIDILNHTSESISSIMPGTIPSYSFESLNLVAILKNIAGWAISHMDSIIGSIYKLTVGFFVMCLALFYFFRDGKELRHYLVNMSPLVDSDDNHIISKLEKTIRSIFTGSIMVAIIQGMLTGVGFAIFGVPSPSLWGVVAAVAALIPGIGTSLILIPGIVYVFISGSIGQTIGLAVWSILAVGLIDNILGPVIMNRGVKIHPFLILLAVLSGLTFFGPIGFILGPIILALLISLLEIYGSSKK